MADLINVRVALRIRPLVDSERESGCQVAVERVTGEPQVVVNGTAPFTFNYVFDENSSQEDLYKDCVYSMLEKLFEGFNATILAYGQTGSGKTHTMGTHYNGVLHEEAGVIPRAMNDIFKRIDELSSEYDFAVTCSFMELYQEQLYDLLSTESREQSVVEMREDRNKMIMQGLSEIPVKTATETTECLVRGSSGRAVASTAMNQHSSRSHAIFTVTIQASGKNKGKSLTSKFHLVDLAGSERSKKTQATGDRFKEGVKINQGLLALGNVISALGTSNGTGFVRYRDSKLTRLLQDSLGGNSITLMIACVSPADYNVPETLSTLRYADRARKIKNKPIVNDDPQVAEINYLKGVIQKLRMEVLNSRGNLSGSLTIAIEAISPNSNKTLRPAQETESAVLKELQDKYRTLQKQFQLTLHDVAENEMRAHIAEMAHVKLKAKTNDIKDLVGRLNIEFTEENAMENIKENLALMKQIQETVQFLDEELERTQSEISIQKSNSNAGLSNGFDEENDDDNSSVETKMEIQEMMQEQSDAYTSKQLQYQNQIRQLNCELSLKEQLHQRMAGNLTKFGTLNAENKMKDCELKIQELELEKAELMDKLRCVKENVSAKIAEDRRKRLQTLEQEISRIKRDNVQQAKLLKVKEKETLKIKNLNNEIQAMKEGKVKLIRAMRQESENFRQWKQIREKELIQLKAKDRKMKTEMAKKDALHLKQRNVLKRKCEEAMAINKRLKDAMDRQKVAQSQRQKVESNKDGTVKTKQVVNCAEQELNVILSLVDAEQSLEQLMEDRVIISKRISELETSKLPLSEELVSELGSLKEELEMRNAQIVDLQQKVCCADINTRMKSIGDNLQSLGDARAVLKHLVKAVSDSRRETASRSIEQKSSYEEQLVMYKTLEEKLNVTKKRLHLIKAEHDEEIAKRENSYEEKITLLLQELHSTAHLTDEDNLTPEQEELLRIQKEQLDKMDAMRIELMAHKETIASLEKALVEKTQKNSRKRKSSPSTTDVRFMDETMFSSEEDVSMIDDDPDWVKTPLVRKKRSNPSRRNTTAFTENSNETFVTATSEVSSLNSQDGNIAHATFVAPAAVKRRSRGCSCRGNCSNNRCGCRSLDENCSITCRCSNLCSNGKPPPTNGESTDSDESTNELKVDEVSNEDTGSNDKKQEPMFLTPKVARLSTIAFNTTSSKKKFFD